MWYCKKVWLVGQHGRRLGGRYSNLVSRYQDIIRREGKEWKLKDTLREYDWQDNKQKDFG
jgi:hypothetical protein